MSQSSRSKAATQTRATRNLCTWQIQLGKSSSILFNCSYLWLSVAICSSWQHVAQQHHSPTIFYCGQVSSMIAVWKLLARQAGFPRASLQFTRFHQHISCSPIEGEKKNSRRKPFPCWWSCVSSDKKHQSALPGHVQKVRVWKHSGRCKLPWFYGWILSQDAKVTMWNDSNAWCIWLPLTGEATWW